MNVCRILMKTRPQTGLTRNSTLSRLINAQPRNNTILSKRFLISSAETGGIGQIKAPRRITSSVKVMAAAGLVTSLIGFQVFSVNEDSINESLGVLWNTTLVAMVVEFVVGLPLIYLILAATIPF